jgi:hypothetical protein
VRKIVVLKPHEWLEKGFLTRSFGASWQELKQRVTPGMYFDDAVPPVRVPHHDASGSREIVGHGLAYTGRAGHGYALSVEFKDDEAAARFAMDNSADVEGVYSDPEIEACPVVCPTNAVGTAADVRQKLNLNPLQADQMVGRGVKIMVVDSGIDQNQIQVAGGFSPNPSVSPGNSPPGHGTMVAYDALIAAPHAMIYDIPLLTSTAGGRWVGLLSDGLRAFAEIMAIHLQVPGPMVVVNSWALYDRRTDSPAGNPQNYCSNPHHPFNTIITALTSAGIDVLFAAGNCGGTWPDQRCGLSDRGPGNSILGANSHPDVITVAAVTVDYEVLGYSSEGPGTLCENKPDIAGFSHFSGSGVYPADTGTSAACPVAAGVVAALRSKTSIRDLAPATIKGSLLRSARRINGAGWNPQIGAGVIDAGAAKALLP